MAHSDSKRVIAREARKPKGAHSKNKEKTEYQKTRDAARSKKHKQSIAIFD